MIIIRIQGGLGNQLFQYAAGKCLAHRLDTVCKLDVSSLHQNQLRKLELDYFSFAPLIASQKEIKQFLYFQSLYRHKPSLFARFGKNIYREPHYHYDGNFTKLKEPLYLDGYWQSEKYFFSVADIIRQGYIIQKPFIAHLENKVSQFQSVNSVAVHIRRGDYSQKNIANYHGILTAAYYNSAIGLLSEKLNNPFFYFFSDDINWVRQNININYPHEFLSGQTKPAIEDFYLMSRCHHNIIANSSFSWWAAWLNNNPEKIVIAPKNWFNKAPLNTKDLIPKDWQLIK
jgi:Glycosyl transferase family 11